MQIKHWRLNLIVIFFLLLNASLGFARGLEPEGRLSLTLEVEDKRPASLLKKIHQEVQEMGRRSDEDFIKREFFMELDGEEKNREEQIVVLIHNYEPREKMEVQVTVFGSERENAYVHYAKETKKIICCLTGEQIEIEHNDYAAEEMPKLLEEILKGIKNKKELLKLIKKEFGPVVMVVLDKK